jgi:Heavy-metal resistance
MRRRLAFAFVLVMAFAASALAQLPAGKWWRRPEIIRQLGLTEDQQTRLDTVFRGAANDLIDLKAEVDKRTIELRGDLDQSQLNRASIQKVAERLNDARSRLFSRELSMLVDMRGVLTDDQWNRMRNSLDVMGPRMLGSGQQRKQRNR